MTDAQTDSSLRDYGLALPHGPNMDRQHVATANVADQVHGMNQNERDIFNHILLPDDSNNEQGQYWADMNILKRFGFANKVDSAEAKKELGQIGRMVKADPLSPVGWYMRNAVIPGAGLLMEGLANVHNVTVRVSLTSAQIRLVLHRQPKAIARKRIS